MQIDVVYLAINIFLLATFVCAGKNFSVGSRKIPGVIACVVVFSVVLGLRYGRGVDYFHYIQVYKYDLESTQKLFTAFNNFLKFCLFSPYSIFFFYALLFIYAGMRLVKKFRDLAKYLFPLFLLAFVVFVEYAIRQAFSFSFVFLYIVQLHRFLFERKVKGLFWALLFATAACSIHSANAIEILFITIIFVISSREVSWKPLVSFYLLSKYFVAQIFDFSWLSRLIVFVFSADEKFAGYVNYSNRWFSTDAVNDIYTRNYFVSVLETFANCFLIYLFVSMMSRMKLTCENTTKEKEKFLMALFYCFVFGTTMLQMFHDIELFRRIFEPLYSFWCFPLSFVLTYRSLYLKKFERKMIIPVILFWGYEFFKYLFVRGGKTLFLWDM